MAALGSLVVKLALDYASYVTGLGKADQQTLGAAKKIQDTMDAVGGKVSGAIAKIGGAVAAGFSAGALVSQINQVKDAAVEVDRFASLAGASLQEFQRFAAGASSVGIGMEKVGDITKDVNDKIGEFLLTGGGEMKDFFEAIAPKVGVTAKEFANLSGPQALQLYYRTLERAGVGQQIMTTQMEALANDASLLAPLLANNGEEMKRLGDQAERSGLVMSDSLVASSKALQDDLNTLSGAATGFRNSLAEGVIPELSNASRAFTEAMTQTGGLNEEAQRLSRDGSVGQWVRAVVVGLSYVMDVGQGAIGLLRMLGKAAAGAVVANMEAVSAMGNAAKQALSGDFSGAWQTLKNGAEGLKGTILAVGSDISEIWNEALVGDRFRAALDTQVSLAKSTGEKVRASLGNGSRVAGAGGGKTPQESDYDKIIKKVQERIHASQAELAAGRELTEQEKFAQKVMEDLGNSKQKVTQAERNRVVALLKESGALDENAQAQRKRVEAEKERITGYEQSVKALTESNKQLREETEMIGLTEQQQAAVTQSRIAATIAVKEQTLAGLQHIGASMKEQDALAEEIRLLRERSTLLGQQATRTTAAKQVEAYQVEWTKFADSVYNGLTDSLFRGFEAGRGFFSSFWAGIKNTLKTSVLKFGIQALVGMSPLGALSSASAATNAIGGGSSALSLASTGKSLYDLYTGGTGLLNGGASTYIQSGINYFSGTGGLVSQGPVQVGGLAQGLGTAGGIAAGVAGGIYGGRAISGGYSAFGNSGNSAVNTGTAVGAAIGSIVPVIGTAVGALVGGLLGGTFNRAFGRKAPEVTDQGIRATLGSNGVSGIQYQNTLEKGGWFRSDRRSSSGTALDAAQAGALKTASDAIYSSSATFGKAMGLNVDAVTSYTKAIDISTKDLKPEEVQAKIAAVFGDLADELANQLLGGISTNFGKQGETAAQTLARLAGHLQAVNGMLDGLNQTLMLSTIAGAAASTKLVDAFGTLEAMQERTASFAQNYYTEAERTAITTRQLTGALQQLGIGALPATREAFRALVEQQDLYTDSGRATYAALLGMSDAFASITPEAAVAATAVDTFVESLVLSAKDLASARASLETELLQAQGRTAELRARELASLDAQDPTGSLRALKEAIYAVGDAADAAKAQADAQAARVTGANSAMAALSQAVGKERETVTASISALTSLSGKLKSTLDSMTAAGTEAQTRAAAQAQISASLAIARAGGVSTIDSEALARSLSIVTQDSQGLFDTREDYLRDLARTAADVAALGDLTGAALSTEQQSLARLDGILVAAQGQIDAMNGVNTSVQTIPAALSGLSAAMAAATGRSASVADPAATVSGLYRDLLGREAEAGGAGFWSTLLSLGVSLEQVRGDIMKSDEYRARVTPVASPAVAGTTSTAGSNAELVAELRALRQEVATKLATSERQREQLIDSSDVTATTLSDAARGNRTIKTEAVPA